MMKSIAFVCVFGLGFSVAIAQSLEDFTNDPLVLAEAYIRGQVQPLDSALTGEAAENPISLAKLPKAPRIKALLHWRNVDRALVSVEFSNARSAQDLYLFLDSLDRGWRISALREFVLPSVYYQQLNHYRNKGERSIRADYQSRLQASVERGVTVAEHEAVHGSVEDKIFHVFNLRLTSSADADLVRHFEHLRPRFEEARRIIDSIPPSPVALEHDNERVGELLRYLLVKRAYHHNGSPLRFEIAAIGGDDLGFLYCDDESCIPTPTPGGVIALRNLGGGWWLYRTT